MPRIYLARHGRSVAQDDDTQYARLGDPQVPLADVGWEQAFGLGRFLQTEFDERPVKDMLTIKVSPFQRPLGTLKGLLHTWPEAERPTITLHNDYHLSEQSFGGLSYLQIFEEFVSANGFECDSQTKDMITKFSHVAYTGSPYIAQPLLGESPIAHSARVDSFIETVFRDLKRGQEDFLVVSHGATTKNILMSWFHLPIAAWRELKTPGNCDVYLIEGDFGDWTIRHIYDGEAGVPCDIDPLAPVTPFTMESLPEIPEHLLNQSPSP